VVGKDVKKLVKYGVNGGIGAGSETGDLPSASSAERLTFTSSLKNLYGTIEISDKAIRASAKDDGAFVNLLNEEMDSLVKSANFNFSRMLFGDGSGFLGQVTWSNQDSVVVESGIQNFMAGMFVDVWIGDEKKYEKLKVVLVEKNTRKVYFAGAPIEDYNKMVGAILRLSGSEADYELTGLSALFSDMEIYRVDRSNSYMRPVISEGGGELTEETLQFVIDQIEENSGSKVNFILCSWAVRRALTRCFKEKQSVLSMMDVGDNQYVLSYNGIPIVTDRFCPEGRMYLLNTNDFKLCQLCDWQWMEGEDGKILKQVPGKPVYTATLVKYAELICQRPCGQGMITDIEV
jgi:hypothetical protein